MGAAVQDVREGGQEEVEALVLGEARDHAEEGSVGLDREADRLLKCGLVGGAMVEGFEGVAAGEVRVGGGVGGFGVDAVEDAMEVGFAVAQEGIEVVAVGGSENLAGIAGADGADLVGEEDAAGDEDEDVAEIGAGWVGDQAVGGQAGGFEDRRVEVALVFEVVDGEDAGGVGEFGRVSVGGAQPVGDQAGVPVVAMDDVGAPVEHAGGFKSGAGEEREAMAVVGVAVDGRTVAEIVRVVDEEHLEAVERHGVDPHGFVAAVEGQVEARDAGAARDAGEVDRAVAGDGDAHVEAAAGQGLGQGGEHVGQAAGLGEGVELGRDHENAEPGAWVSAGHRIRVSAGSGVLRLGRGCRRGRPRRR